MSDKDRKSSVKFHEMGMIEKSEDLPEPTHPALEIRMSQKGPFVLVDVSTIAILRGPLGPKLRDVILDAVKGTLDKICVH